MYAFAAAASLVAGLLHLRRSTAAPPKQARIGILGTAAIASKNSLGITTGGHCVAAIGSRSQAKAEAWARAHAPRAACYGSYEALLADASLHAVYIPLPCGLHGEWVRRAAAAGKGVLVEKPTARSLGELEGMVRACAAAGVPFLDGTMFHFHAREAEMERAIRAPAFGALTRVNSAFSFCGDQGFRDSNIRMDPALEPMGCLGDLGQYCIRFGLWAYGWELPASVRAVAHARNPRGVPTDTSCTFTWASGKVLQCDNSFNHAFRQWGEVVGTGAVLRCEDFVISQSHASCAFQVTTRPDLDALHSSVVGTTTRSRVLGCNQEAQMWRQFGAAALARTFVPLWAERSLKVQACLDAAFASMAADGAETAVARPRALDCVGRGGCGEQDCPCRRGEPPRPPRRAPLLPPQLKSMPKVLAPGEELYLCSCGASATYPLCDGSHRAYNAQHGTTFAPTKVVNATQEPSTVYLWCVRGCLAAFFLGA